MMMILYHRTTSDAAERILATGFRDNTDPYMTTKEWTGVWLSDVPLDANEGAWGDVLLKITLSLSEEDISQYEWIEEQKGCREWLVPSEVINRMEAVEIDEETSGAVEVEGAGHFSVSMIPPMPSSVTRLSLMLLGRNWPRQTEFDGA